MKGLTDTEILHRTAEIKYKIMIHFVMIHIYNQWRQSCWSALGRQLLPKFFCLSSFHVPQPIWLSPPFASDISNQFWQWKHLSVNIFFYRAHHYMVWGAWKVLGLKNCGKSCLRSVQWVYSAVYTLPYRSPGLQTDEEELQKWRRKNYRISKR